MQQIANTKDYSSNQLYSDSYKDEIINYHYSLNEHRSQVHPQLHVLIGIDALRSVTYLRNLPIQQARSTLRRMKMLVEKAADKPEATTDAE